VKRPERAAVAGVDHALEDARGLVDEVGVAWVGQLLGHDEQRLRLEVERRLGDDLERALGHAHLAAHEVEGARGGERRRHERHRGAAGEQLGAQQLAHVDGLGPELGAPLVVDVEPVDAGGVRLRSPSDSRAVGGGRVLGHVARRGALLLVRELVLGAGFGERHELAERALEGRVVGEARRLEPLLVPGRAGEVGERREQALRLLAKLSGELLVPEVGGRRGEPPEGVLREREAEELAGDLRGLVRLVEHEQVEGGQHEVLPRCLAHGEVREQHVVVRDDDVRALRDRLRPLGEAVVAERAAVALALLGADRERDQTCACGMNASSETSPVFVASAHASTSSTCRCWSSS
jgi:hypothetical protein